MGTSDFPNCNVSQLLNAAQLVARKKQVTVHLKWIELSWSLGALIAEGAALTIQSLGSIDMLLRVLEDERIATVHSVEEQVPNPQDFSLEIQVTLSEFWVGSAYAIFRCAKEKKPCDDTARRLHDDLRLVRVPLEKYQIPQDYKLLEPIPMGVIGSEGGDIRMYDKNDKDRSHIIGRNISGRGSVEWMTVDAIRGLNVLLERRELSNRILAYCANNQLV